MRSLRTKLVMIMVILILALMCVIGAFLINGVGNFYISQFYEQMEKTFSPDFIGQLQTIPAQEQSAPVRMKELLMAQARRRGVTNCAESRLVLNFLAGR